MKQLARQLSPCRKYDCWFRWSCRRGDASGATVVFHQSNRLIELEAATIRRNIITEMMKKKRTSQFHETQNLGQVYVPHTSLRQQLPK